MQRVIHYFKINNSLVHFSHFNFKPLKGKRITSRSHNIDPLAGAVSEFSPQSEEEEEEMGNGNLQCNGFRSFLAPSSFECEDESEVDPTYVYCKNIHQQGKRSTGIIEFSPAKAGMDVTPACYDFSNRKTVKNKRSATMHSLASALSNVTNLALGTARHHSSPLRTRTSTESDHQQQINRTNRVMASVDEETTAANNTLATQSAMQSLDGGTNVSRTSRTGSGTLSVTAVTAVPFSTIPNTRAERSSAALYTAILNRVDHIQNQMNNYENILLQKLDTITKLLQLTLPETIMINNNLTKVEDYLLEPLTNNSKSLQMPIINSSLIQQQSSSTRMCKSYTDLVSSLKRGSTITLEEHPKSENCDILPSRSNQLFSTTLVTHSLTTTSQQQSSQSSSSRPILQQQQRIYNLPKYPFRNAQSMFESYDNNNNNLTCQSNLSAQLSTTVTTISTNLITTTSVQSNNNYLTTSTNFNLGHSLASLELSDIDLDELDESAHQINELQLLINQPVSTTQQDDINQSFTNTSSRNSSNPTSSNPNSSNQNSSLTTLRPRSPFDQVSSSYSNRPFQRAASSNLTTSIEQSEQDLRRSISSSLVAHETTISRLGNTTLTSVTNAPLSSIITITQSSTTNNQSTNNQTQRQDNKNVDNV